MLTRSLPGLEVPDLKSVQCTPSNSIPPGWEVHLDWLDYLSPQFQGIQAQKHGILKFELHNMYENGQRF